MHGSTYSSSKNMFYGKLLSLFASCILVVCNIRVHAKGPTVTIKHSQIVGEFLTSEKGREYIAFKGIPYVRPHISYLLFQTPQPTESWERTLKTLSKLSLVCCQSRCIRNELEGQEDCLFINVYTPKLSGNLPVMVFIHGGRYYSGSGTFLENGPQLLMDKDIVLATFNYRLEHMDGINGHLIQIAALKWVQENIQSFGGNKSKITIYGESIGADSVIHLVLSSLAKGNAQESPTVTIRNGKIVGETLKSTKGRDYSAFAGIPYAKPPIGDLRFEAPQPVESWEGELKTSIANGPQCTQADMFTNEIKGQEDCLYVNVYTPNHTDKFPVMVWIHGGGFNAGSGTFQEYGPQRLMDKDIVLVTVNYRLGPMAYPEQGFQGNNGLLDQIAALKWVQENIERFGGDKSRVTIFGESAGGASVIHLLLSPLATGLFHGAIAQSGSALCNWALNPHPTQCARFLSIKLNCPTAPIEEMMKCLRQKPWQDILKKNKEFEIYGMLPIIQRPSVDGKVVADKPISLLKAGKMNSVPVIIGTNTEEGATYVAILRKAYPRTGEIYLKEDLGEVLSIFPGIIIKPEKVEEIRKMYFENVDVNSKSEFNKALVKVFTDSVFGCTQRTAKYLANVTENPTFVYSFSYRGKDSMVQNEEEEDLGVGHGEELQFLFHNVFAFPSNLTGNDVQMSEIMLSLWTNFAKTQNPTPNDAKNGDKLSFTWPRFKPEDQKCINLNLNSTITDDCESKHVGFWINNFSDSD